MTLTKFLIIIVFTVSNLSTRAATYYFSNAGKDSNNGISPLFPLKTILKLNSLMSDLLPGDAVLFERGGYFTGQINLERGGNAVNPIIFGAYGEGRNPIISGAIQITGWKLYNDKIYFAEVDTAVKNFFAGGEQMILARYPNKNFLTIDRSLPNPNKGFYDAALNQKKDYWKGANLRVRTINWAYEFSPVEEFASGTVTLKNETLYPMQEGWGYYFDNVLSELDSEGEWYFQSDRENESKGKIYFFPLSDLNPENVFAEAGIFSFGFYSGKTLSNILIRDLEIRGQNVSGIFLQGKTAEVKIENCSFKGQMESGVEIKTLSQNVEINNCRFSDIKGRAISFLKTNHSSVSNNIFRRIGMIPGYGVTGDACGMSAVVILYSNSNHIYKNNIDSVGHDGIDCIGISNVIEKNIISNTLLLLNDGGAIKSYGSDNTNSVWNNNFIYDVIGNLDAASGKETQLSAVGVYLDEYCSEMKVLDNTIMNCSLSGINFYNANFKNQVYGNICFNNRYGILFIKAQKPITDNSISNNIFFGLTQNQYSVVLKTLSTGFVPGKFDYNYYCNPFNENLFMNESYREMVVYNFNGWKKLIGNDNEKNSKVLTGNEVMFPGMFRNMTDDTAVVFLNPSYSYKELNMKSVNGSVSIPPYYSRILLANENLNSNSEMLIAGGPLNFEKNNSSPLWYNLIADNLNGNVTVTAPDGFEVSFENDINYSKKIVAVVSDGKINKIIYVKFVPGEDKDYNGTIVNETEQLKSLVKLSVDKR